MEKLSEQFKDALTRIEIRGERLRRAIAAHTEIRSYLERDNLLCSWGVDTILIGSYARRTGIHPGKDVDVFTKLMQLNTAADPRKVYEAVLAVLEARYGERAHPQDRSIKVSFSANGDEFAVDVVPAVRMGERWGIPQHDTRRWDDPNPSERWVETDPEKLTELTSMANEVLTVEGQGAYVPTVKLVRQLRQHHLGDRKPGGLYFELLTYWAFQRGITGDSFAEILAATLRSIAAQLASGTVLVDPVLNRPYAPEPDAAARVAAASALGDLAAQAVAALAAARCPAAVLWRAVLGSNDRGVCFPLPAGCDERGEEIKDVTRVVAVGSREPSGFA